MYEPITTITIFRAKCTMTGKQSDRSVCPCPFTTKWNKMSQLRGWNGSIKRGKWLENGAWKGYNTSPDKINQKPNHSFYFILFHLICLIFVNYSSVQSEWKIKVNFTPSAGKPGCHAVDCMFGILMFECEWKVGEA